MNRLHDWYCNREAWKRHVREDLVPPALQGIDLGENVLEVGPGFGPATEALAAQTTHLTALELDPKLASSLRAKTGPEVEVIEGDGTSMPFDDETFSGAACFTMLHHSPPPSRRINYSPRSTGYSDPAAYSPAPTASGGLGFALFHIGDINLPLDPATPASRLEAVGFDRVSVGAGSDHISSDSVSISRLSASELRPSPQCGLPSGRLRRPMSELSENAKLALDSLETKPALNTPALIAQNEGIERAEAEQGLFELLELGLVKQSVMGWKLKKQ